MIYIAKKLGSNKYSVVDTSDSSEEVLDAESIVEAVKLGVKVHGVSMYNNRVSIKEWNTESFLAELSLLGFKDCKIDGLGRASACLSTKCLHGDTLSIPEGLELLHTDGTLPDSIKNVVIPSTLKICPNALSCSSVEKVLISEGLQDLPNSLLYKCKQLREVSLPSSLKSLGSYAFCGCEKLQSIKLPDGLDSIGAYCFLRCRALKEVYIPSSVKIIGTSCFTSSGIQNLSVSKNTIFEGNSRYLTRVYLTRY